MEYCAADTTGKTAGGGESTASNTAARSRRVRTKEKKRLCRGELLDDCIVEWLALKPDSVGLGGHFEREKERSRICSPAPQVHARTHSGGINATRLVVSQTGNTSSSLGSGHLLSVACAAFHEGSLISSIMLPLLDAVRHCDMSSVEAIPAETYLPLVKRYV